MDKFTIKAQEAIQEAVNLVQARGQQAIEPEHLLAGILKVGKTSTNFLFQKLGVNSRQIEQILESQIASLPKVQGGEPYLSRESNRSADTGTGLRFQGRRRVRLARTDAGFADREKYGLQNPEKTQASLNRNWHLPSTNCVKEKK